MHMHMNMYMYLLILMLMLFVIETCHFHVYQLHLDILIVSRQFADGYYCAVAVCLH